MKRLSTAAAIGLLLAPAAAFALPAYFKLFLGTYPVPKGSALEKSRCAACHVGTSTKLNPYGKDVEEAMKTMKAKSLTPQVLRAVENLDSDKDGISNIKEIKAGTLPGDAKNK